MFNIYYLFENTVLYDIKNNELFDCDACMRCPSFDNASQNKLYHCFQFILFIIKLNNCLISNINFFASRNTQNQKLSLFKNYLMDIYDYKCLYQPLSLIIY